MSFLSLRPFQEKRRETSIRPPNSMKGEEDKEDKAFFFLFGKPEEMGKERKVCPFNLFGLFKRDMKKTETSLS